MSVRIMSLEEDEDFDKAKNLSSLSTTLSNIVRNTDKSIIRHVSPTISYNSNVVKNTCTTFSTAEIFARCNNDEAVFCTRPSGTVSSRCFETEQPNSPLSFQDIASSRNSIALEMNQPTYKTLMHTGSDNDIAEASQPAIEHLNVEEANKRKRKIHLGTYDCLEYSKSADGGKALAEPLMVVRSSRDPNTGLHPKPFRYNKKFLHPHTSLAETQSKPNCSYNINEHTPTKKRKPFSPSSKPSPQRNLIINYFGGYPADKQTKPALDDHGALSSSQSSSGDEGISTPEKTPTSSQSQHAQCRTPSKMFSPVKQISGTSVYTVDSSPEHSRKIGKLSKREKLFSSGTTEEAENDSDSASSFEMSDNELMDCVDKYGLLGSGNYPRDPDANTNFFELLPVDIIENIFCYLPILDVCVVANRVCHSWNSIISNPLFFPWKKKYFKLTMRYGTVVKDMDTLLEANGMTRNNNLLTGLIRYMKSNKPLTAENMLECLQKHPKYTWAEALMEERFKDCYINEEPHPGCLLAILVIISDSVTDISDILTQLLSPKSQSRTMLIIDTMYCLATFLLTFKLHLSRSIWNGMHYRLYYGLYLFENSSGGNTVPVSRHGNKKLRQHNLKSGDSRLHLTNEQLRICNYDMQLGETVKIVAFAGTGKTSTLVAFTQMRPRMKFLMIVYNKSARDHGIKIFPPNVTCKTSHSLAYGKVGQRYSAVKKLGPEMKVFDAAQILQPRKGENLFIRSKHVLQTIKSYLASSDDDICLSHTPHETMSDRGLEEPICPKIRENYVKDAKYLWDKMKDLRCTNVKMTHDGYLKLYQLSRPKLRNYDCILIDEAQDLTPAIADILLTQEQSKILVGDPHQQIYAFRGAVNALDNIEASRVFYLTQSFRFGPEIARVASCCLERLKKERKCLVGSSAQDSVSGEHEGQIAIISRTNFGLFNEAVKKCCFSEKEYKVHIIGGVERFGFPMIQEIYALMLSPEDRIKEGRKITNKLLRNLGNITALEKYATDTMDPELSGKIKIVRTFHHILPQCIKTILQRSVGNPEDADIIFSTAHKAKGLEFTAVKIVNDFLNGLQISANISANNLPIDPITLRGSDDEYNLLYVAVTRAKKSLQMSPVLNNILSNVGFDQPVSSKKLKAEGKAFKCSLLSKEFQPNALTLVYPEISLSDGSKLAEAMFSPEAISLGRGPVRTFFLSMWSGLLGKLPENSNDKEEEKPPTQS